MSTASGGGGSSSASIRRMRSVSEADSVVTTTTATALAAAAAAGAEDVGSPGPPGPSLPTQESSLPPALLGDRSNGERSQGLTRSHPLDPHEDKLAETLSHGLNVMKTNFLTEVELLQSLLQQRRSRPSRSEARSPSPEGHLSPSHAPDDPPALRLQTNHFSSIGTNGSPPRSIDVWQQDSTTPTRTSLAPEQFDSSTARRSELSYQGPVLPTLTSPRTSLQIQPDLSANKAAPRPPPAKLIKTQSNWSEFLYADDRAAQRDAKEKSIHELLQSIERDKAMEDQPEPGWAKQLVDSTAFELGMGLLIFLNSILMGAELQYRTVNNLPKEPVAFTMVTHTFTIMFLLELLLRIKAKGIKDLFWTHGLSWAWLDLVIVLTALVELVSDCLDLAGQAAPKGFGGLTQVRMTRIMRMVRLVRALRIQRIIRFVAPLRTLVVSILATLKSLTWAMSLMIILIYIVALIISEGALDWRLNHINDGPIEVHRELLDYWISLDRAMFTLFQSFTGGVSWRDATSSLEEVHLAFAWLLTTFVGFVFFALLNVMTGVFCSSAIETAQRNPEFVASSVISSRKAYCDNLRSLFQTVDEDSSGLITLTELEKILKNDRMRAHLAALEIDVTDAWTLFRLLDSDHSGVIEIEEFLQGCEHLKGHAKGIDLATLNFEIKNLGKKLVKMSSSTEDQLELLRRQLG